MKEKLGILQMIGAGIAGFAAFLLSAIGFKEWLDKKNQPEQKAVEGSSQTEEQK